MTTSIAFAAMSRRLALCALLALVATSPARAGETITFFHNDVAGSPAVATDVNGIQAWKETYRPYGDQLIDSAAATNNKLWFTGKSFDDSTGLSYMGARYYDPTLGRFMAVDPVSFDLGNLHSFNRYAYANNNPYKFVDPDGREAATAQWLQQTNAFTDRMTANLTKGEAAVLLAGQLGMLALPLAIDAAIAAFAAPEVALGIAEVALAGDALGPGSLVVVGSVVKLADEALVVRGGANITAESIAAGTSTHPTAGVTGFSAESANGASLCDLCANIPNNQVGVTTAGEIRAAGGDVVPTPGKSANHATVTGLNPEKASKLLSPSSPNPVPKGERTQRR